MRRECEQHSQTLPRRYESRSVGNKLSKLIQKMGLALKFIGSALVAINSERKELVARIKGSQYLIAKHSRGDRSV